MLPHERELGTSSIPADLAVVAPVDGALVSSTRISPVSASAHAGSGSLDLTADVPPPPPRPLPASIADLAGESVTTATPPGRTPPTAGAGLVDAQQQVAFLDALPVATLLVDGLGSVRHLNDRASALIKLPKNELLGRSVLDFVGVDHIDFVVDLMNTAGRFDDVIMGPSRVQYVDADGEQHWTQVWARMAPAEVCEGGFIVTLTSESVRDVVSVIATTAGADDTLDTTLTGIAESARGLPLAATGAVLTVEASSQGTQPAFRLFGRWPVDHALIDDPSMPWRRALETIDACDIDDIASSDLPAAVRKAFEEAGIHALFVRPIADTSTSATGVFVVFRRRVGAASTNMNDHIDDVVRLARFSFAMARRHSELEQASYRDALTGLANRAAFNDRLRAERRATDVLFVDLDHFKDVNDTYGHEVGDRVLVMAAERLETTLRSDARAFRTGGDEFIVLCESTGDDPSERIALAERIIDVLMTPFDADIHRVRIGATIGIAASGTRSLVDTVRAADTALYSAKRRGRSGWAHEGR